MAPSLACPPHVPEPRREGDHMTEPEFTRGGTVTTALERPSPTAFTCFTVGVGNAGKEVGAGGKKNIHSHRKRRSQMRSAHAVTAIMKRMHVAVIQAVLANPPPGRVGNERSRWCSQSCNEGWWCGSPPAPVGPVPPPELFLRYTSRIYLFHRCWLGVWLSEKGRSCLPLLPLSLSVLLCVSAGWRQISRQRSAAQFSRYPLMRTRQVLICPRECLSRAACAFVQDARR